MIRQLRHELARLDDENRTLRAQIEFGSGRAAPQNNPHPEFEPGGPRVKKFGLVKS